jgi:hypothetical protein
VLFRGNSRWGRLQSGVIVARIHTDRSIRGGHGHVLIGTLRISQVPDLHGHNLFVSHNNHLWRRLFSRRRSFASLQRRILVFGVQGYDDNGVGVSGCGRSSTTMRKGADRALCQAQIVEELSIGVREAWGQNIRQEEETRGRMLRTSLH